MLKDVLSLASSSDICATGVGLFARSASLVRAAAELMGNVEPYHSHSKVGLRPDMSMCTHHPVQFYQSIHSLIACATIGTAQGTRHRWCLGVASRFVRSVWFKLMVASYQLNCSTCAACRLVVTTTTRACYNLTRSRMW